MDGRPKRLALDVPERLVDAGNGAHMDGAAAIEPAAIQDVPVILDQERIFPDQVIFQFVDGSLHRQRPALDHRFAPAGNTFIRLDLQEQPAWRNDVGGELGNFHRVMPSC